MRVLVTGGAGFIGSHLVDLLVARGDEVLVLDNLESQVHPTGQWPEYLDSARKAGRERLRLVLGDVRHRADLQAAFWSFEPEAVVHLAAMVGVGQSAIAPDVYVDYNVTGTACLQRVMQEYGNVQRYIAASSMSCYGEGAYVPSQEAERYVSAVRMVGSQPSSRYRNNYQRAHIRRPDLRPEERLACGLWEPLDLEHASLTPVAIPEHASLNATSVYAESKASTERLALMWGKHRAVPTATPRFFNVYGPRQALSNPYTGVGAIFASRLLRGESVRIYEDGQQMRDFVHVSDVARALAMLLGNAFSGPVNVGTGEPTTIYRLAHELAARLQPEAVPGDLIDVPGEWRTGDIRSCFADATLIHALGWRAEVPLYGTGPSGECGVADLARWAQRHAEEARLTTNDPHAEMANAGMIGRRTS